MGSVGPAAPAQMFDPVAASQKAGQGVDGVSDPPELAVPTGCIVLVMTVETVDVGGVVTNPMSRSAASSST